MTDESRMYNGLDEKYASHEITNHSAKECVRGDVHSNTVEGVFLYPEAWGDRSLPLYQ